MGCLHRTLDLTTKFHENQPSAERAELQPSTPTTPYPPLEENAPVCGTSDHLCSSAPFPWASASAGSRLGRSWVQECSDRSKKHHVTGASENEAETWFIPHVSHPKSEQNIQLWWMQLHPHVRAELRAEYIYI